MYRQLNSRRELMQRGITLINRGELESGGFISCKLYREFEENPTRENLLKVLINPYIAEDDKRLIVTGATNIPFSWSGVSAYACKKKPNTDDRIILTEVIAQCPDIIVLQPEDKAKWLVEYTTNKSKTQIYANHELQELVVSLKDQGVHRVQTAIDGHGDITWKDDEKEHAADAVIWPHDSNKRIVVYARYGNCGGGNQNDRHSGIMSTARDNPDTRFLFLVDGMEAMEQFNKYRKRLHFHKRVKLFKDEHDIAFDYTNSIWCTIKFLQFMDWHDFKLDLSKTVKLVA